MVENQKPVDRDTTEARAGVTGHNARYVLLVSTTAVVIAFAVVYFLIR